MITPNLDEAGALLGRELRSLTDAVHAAHDPGTRCALGVERGHLRGPRPAPTRCAESTVAGVTAVADRPVAGPATGRPGGRPPATGPLAVDGFGHDGTVELLAGPGSAPATTTEWCTFSAALTAALARGSVPRTAVRAASVHVRRALAGAVDWLVGSGAGPLSWETR